MLLVGVRSFANSFSRSAVRLLENKDLISSSLSLLLERVRVLLPVYRNRDPKKFRLAKREERREPRLVNYAVRNN